MAKLTPAGSPAAAYSFQKHVTFNSTPLFCVFSDRFPAIPAWLWAEISPSLGADISVPGRRYLRPCPGISRPLRGMDGGARGWRRRLLFVYYFDCLPWRCTVPEKTLNNYSGNTSQLLEKHLTVSAVILQCFFGGAQKIVKSCVSGTCAVNIAYRKENCNDLFKEWGLGASGFFSMGGVFRRG